MFKTIALIFGLLFTPMGAIAQETPTPTAPVVECLTPSDILTQLKAEPTVTVKSHKVFSGEDAKELARTIGEVVGQVAPEPYTIITATILTTPVGLVTLFVLYNEKSCAYTKATFNEVLMKSLKEKLVNSNVRFE